MYTKHVTNICTTIVNNSWSTLQCRNEVTTVTNVIYSQNTPCCTLSFSYASYPSKI